MKIAREPDRVSCRCERCRCRCSADRLAQVCSLCRAGYHHRGRLGVVVNG